MREGVGHRVKARTFVDVVTLFATGGRGGDGCCSFRREKYVPRGGPDGGDGGRGGHVILRADPNENSLVRIFFAPHQRAQNGGHGQGKKMKGRDGQDTILPVPCGTVVRDPETGLILAELLEPGEDVVVARGGRGGLGNVHWKSSTRRAPRTHTPGEPGESVRRVLELKLLADAALVGMPNAGKSSLLRRLSDARPRVAAYPFTTLTPIVGTLVFPDHTRMILADIPGLIAGSHAGAGLGHAFLRHIERCSLLLYVLDMAATEGRDPFDDYHTLQTELERHQPDLRARPFLVVANKMDRPQAEQRHRDFVTRTGLRPLPVSALTGAGIERLKRRLFALHRRQHSRNPTPRSPVPAKRL